MSCILTCIKMHGSAAHTIKTKMVLMEDVQTTCDIKGFRDN